MDDAIGRAPEPQRRRRALRRPTLSGGRWRRVAVGLAVAGVAVTGVAVGRQGLDRGGTSPAAGPATRTVQGDLLQLAAGQDTVYALIEDCVPGTECRVTLVASGDDGRTWRILPLPDGPPDAETAKRWRLQVTGPEDQLSMEDGDAGVVHLGTGTFETRRVVPGPPVARVPANRERLVELCGRPGCAVPTLRFLEPRTGVRSPLAVQPPVPPRLLDVEGPQLWVAGTDPRTGRWVVAVSTDDGSSWRAVPVDRRAGGELSPRLVAVPEQDMAYLLLGTPGQIGPDRVQEVWTVRTRAAAAVRTGSGPSTTRWRCPPRWACGTAGSRSAGARRPWSPRTAWSTSWR